ncbi:MAG: hypothetical protein DDT21_02196 [Syntrophomonadaceae bacterium]|nr:hypothetical protein [Bacillota bacterium]
MDILRGRHAYSRMLVCLLLTLALLFPAQAVAAQPVTVTLDGRALAMDVPPVVRDGRTLLPMRAIFEALGAAVEWDAATRSVTARSQGRTVVLRAERDRISALFR